MSTATETAGSGWAGPLTVAGRRVLAARLDSAARRIWGAAEPRRAYDLSDPAAAGAYDRGTRLLAAWDEICSLLPDVQAAASTWPEAEAKAG